MSAPDRVVAPDPSLWCVRAGDPDGIRIVFVHGSMDRGAAFARTAGLLRDFSTLRYDRRGYGRSQPLGATDIAGHAEDLVSLLEREPAVLVGHSLGGLVAMRVAGEHPELVRAVACFEMPMPWHDQWPRQSAGGVAVGGGGPVDPGEAVERFLRRMIGDARWEALSPNLQAERRAEGPALLADLRAARAGGAPYDLSVVRAPVLSGRGTRSEPHHRFAAEELARQVGREIVVIEGAGHGAHLSHPAPFAQFVRQAVALAGPASSSGGAASGP